MKKDPLQKATSQLATTIWIQIAILAAVAFGAVSVKAYQYMAHTKELESSQVKLDQQQRYSELYSKMHKIEVTLSAYMEKIKVIGGYKTYTRLSEELTNNASGMKLRMDCSVPVLKEKNNKNTSFVQPAKISGRYNDLISFYQYLIRKEQIQCIKFKQVKVTDANNLECDIELLIKVENSTDTNSKKKGA